MLSSAPLKHAFMFSREPLRICNESACLIRLEFRLAGSFGDGFIEELFHLASGLFRKFALLLAEFALLFTKFALLLAEGAHLFTQLALLITGVRLEITDLALQVSDFGLNMADLVDGSAAGAQLFQFGFEFFQFC